MKNKNIIHLSDVSPALENSHVKLDLDFLDKLLKSSSKSKNPARDRKFIESIGGKYNDKAGCYTAISNWLRGQRTVPFGKLVKIVEMSDYSLQDLQKYIISIKSGIKKGEIYPDFPIEIGKEIGSIIGHILGDGSIDNRYKQVFFSNTNPELLEEFILYMRNVFGIEPRIWVQEKTAFHDKTRWIKRVSGINQVPKGHPVGLFYPRICGLILHAIFGDFANGKYKNITKQIKDSNKNFKIGLLRAFFDDEGSVSAKNHMARLYQDNKELLKDVKSLLAEFNIHANPIRHYVKRGKKRYTVGITGFREYYNFYSKIGCTSSKKREEFEKLIMKVAHSKSFKKTYCL